jgi:hypothetical protein
MGILADASRGSVWQCGELSLLVATIRASVGCFASGPSGNLNSAEAERSEAIVGEARSRSDVCAQVRAGPPCGP